MAVAALSAAMVVSGCSPLQPDGQEPSSPPPPSPIPGDTAELQDGFEELSGLVLPSNTSDLEIEGKYLSDDRPYYELRFETTRGGAEVICTADNFGTYVSSGPPDEEQHELFDIQEDDGTIAETVKCQGSNPDNGRVQRQVAVLFPEDGLQQGEDEPDGEDTAIVYAYSVLWPAR
ncbi:hypothetical protein F4561_001353 [Lipingzhangella halophila]|uniref:Uncharacterized protein n=1 Tax=Lipingzhangella halophila TaxID=1783352 RepID=A0A7W7RF71_9ACTN|nr:hypothetical protein [Lipingzhangella halophila]MBB4930533.1 hypothetical protein [Lipingzhangella halophila]